jgi:nucleotide-binding universal stress UspA family protein
MRTLLVPLSGQYDTDDPNALDEPALAAAFTLGRRIGAHVEAFCIEAERAGTQLSLAPWIPGSAIELVLSSIEQESESRRRRSRTLFDATTARFGKPPVAGGVPCAGFCVDFIEAPGPVGASVATRGRLADLVVTANLPGAIRDDMPPTLRSALYDTGRPVLIAPALPPASIGRSVLVAWDGGREAARAMAAARPLLARAERVTVISVQRGKPGLPGPAEVVGYLGWHDVAAEPVVLQPDDRSTAELLLDAAAARGADLLVMGSSLRGTLHRLVMGDVMDEVLAGADLPVLMAH